MIRNAIVLAALLCAPVAAIAAETLPIEEFVRHQRYGVVKISPTGEYLAVTLKRGSLDILQVFTTKDQKLVSTNQLSDDRSVSQFYWVSANRLMFTAARDYGSFARPFGTGEWFGVNADGTERAPLIFYGTRDATQRGKQIGRERFSMLDPLPSDPKRALMHVSSPRSAEGVHSELAYVDVFTGRQTTLVKAPRENCSFALDARKLPQFAVCSDSKDAEGKYAELTELYRRDDKSWTLINRSASDGHSLEVLGSSPDGRIYAMSDDRKVPAAFGTIDAATGKFSKLFQDPVAEVSSYIVASDGDTVLGVVTEAGVPRVEMIDETHPDSKIYQSLSAAFPGQFVNFSTATTDGSQIVVSVSSDRNPGELYLFDRASGKARFLMSRLDWVDPKKMSPMQAITYKSRDGLTIHAYLTVPQGSTGKNLPLIIHPHGGPIGINDSWGFQPAVQMLANRGYAVLQVNYRGSSGFGQAFEDMGHREWGGKMQDDLTDATRWAIAQGVADPARICIFGGSYGGYASLMGVAKEPGLYKCAIGYVGMYDVQIQLKLSDTSDSNSGRRYFDRTFGTERAEQDRISPVNHADKIKAAVFLAAGARDPRCPPEHTEAMRDALKKAGNPPEEVIIASGEMHGFYKEEANLNLYTKMLAFLDKHIGRSAGAGAAAAGPAKPGAD